MMSNPRASERPSTPPSASGTSRRRSLRRFFARIGIAPIHCTPTSGMACFGDNVREPEDSSASFGRASIDRTRVSPTGDPSFDRLHTRDPFDPCPSRRRRLMPWSRAPLDGPDSPMLDAYLSFSDRKSISMRTSLTRRNSINGRDS
jgi:hypothetical protein